MIPFDVTENSRYPLNVFRFHVDFHTDSLTTGGGEPMPLCSGAFAECSGLEATMEPKVIKEGGRNYGDAQRVGSVTFATIVLKRGMTVSRDLWKWFELVSQNGAYSYRLAAIVRMYNNSGEERIAWRLDKALPVKFKAADLNARGTEVAIEELHLVHEGLSLVSPNSSAGSTGGGKKQ